jgi:cell division protease FtsH
VDRLLKNIAFWTLVVLAVLFFYKFMQAPRAPLDVMDSIRFMDALRAGEIARITLPRDASIGGELVEPGPDGKPKRFIIATPEYRDLVDDLLRHDVTVDYKSPRESSPLTTVLSWMPMLVLIGIWIFFMRAMQRGRPKKEEGPGPPLTP